MLAQEKVNIQIFQSWFGNIGLFDCVVFFPQLLTPEKLMLSTFIPNTLVRFDTSRLAVLSYAVQKSELYGAHVPT